MELQDILKKKREERNSNILKGFFENDIEKARKQIQRKEGDIHPNGLWEWRKTPSGYDWRNVKKDVVNQRKKVEVLKEGNKSEFLRPDDTKNTVIESKTILNQKDKYIGNVSEKELKKNEFVFRRNKDDILNLSRPFYITNVTDKNIMYFRKGSYSMKSERISIEQFDKYVEQDRVVFSNLEILNKKINQDRFSESDLMKNLLKDLHIQTADLKDEFIKQTEEYRRKEYKNIELKYSKFTYQDFIENFGGVDKYRTGKLYLTREGEAERSRIVSILKSGENGHVEKYKKLAEMHYESSLKKLKNRIYDWGFNVDSIKVSSSHIGVNFETIVTDGEKRMRAYTIVASGPIMAPHYRYLFSKI